MRNRYARLAVLTVGAVALAYCTGQENHLSAPQGRTTSSRDAHAVGDHGGGIPYGIALVSTLSGNADIWVMNASGSDPDQPSTLTPARDLTSDNPGTDTWPAWSNNGRIAFSSARDGHANLEIYAMDADGSNVTRVTTMPGADNVQPAWSPNGKEIAFAHGSAATASARGNRQIFVVNLGSGAVRQLTSCACDNYRPAWSPDGKTIAFASDRNGDFANAQALEKSASFGLHDIYIMSASDGTILSRVTNDPTALDGEPAFSPDGHRLAFRSRRATDATGAHWCSIAVANIDGSDVRLLTPKPDNVPTAQWCNAFPAWSRDGKRIYFHSARFGIPLDLYVVGVDGSGLQRLTYDAAAETAPAVR